MAVSPGHDILAHPSYIRGSFDSAVGFKSRSTYSASQNYNRGGALLRGLDKRLSMKTKLPIHIAEDPLRAVVRGTGLALKNLNQFKPVLMT